MNVGIIGAGYIGELHGQAISRVEGLKVSAVCRTAPGDLKRIADEFQAKAYTDYRELLADGESEIIVVATPHHLHTEIAVQSALSGKHVMIEKPLALTLQECDRILETAKQAQVKLSVGFCHRFAKAFQKTKEILDSGEIGSLVLGTATMSKFWMEGNRRSWHLDRKTGGGMWLTAGIHCLDRLSWLMNGRILTVSGRFSTAFHDQRADDAGMVFVRYSNGACGAIVSVGYKDGAPKNLMELTGTKGMIAVDYSGISLGKNGVWRKIDDFGNEKWMPHALTLQWRKFAEAVKNDTEPPVTGEYAREIMEAAFAAELSSRYGREIGLPLREELEADIERTLA